MHHDIRKIYSNILIIKVIRAIEIDLRNSIFLQNDVSANNDPSISTKPCYQVKKPQFI